MSVDKFIKDRFPFHSKHAGRHSTQMRMDATELCYTDEPPSQHPSWDEHYATEQDPPHLIEDGFIPRTEYYVGVGGKLRPAPKEVYDVVQHRIGVVRAELARMIRVKRSP